MCADLYNTQSDHIKKEMFLRFCGGIRSAKYLSKNLFNHYCHYKSVVTKFLYEKHICMGFT